MTKLSLKTLLVLVSVTAWAIGLPGCGGEGGGGDSSFEPVTGSSPPGPSGGPELTPREPPPDPPPADDPDPDPTDPPDEDPAPDPTDPPPGDPADPSRPLPAPTFPTYEAIGDVHALAVDPGSEAVFLVDTATGELRVLMPGADDPEPRGNLEVRGVRALATDAATHTLLAVLDGGAGADDVLYRLQIEPPEATALGTIDNYDAVEALAVHGETGDIYAVDTEQDVLLKLDPADGTPTVVGPLGSAARDLRGLTWDLDSSLLVGTDSETSAVVAIDVATGTARRLVTLPEGPMDGFAYAPSRQWFFGVSAADAKLYVLDAKGSWMSWAEMRGLTHDTQQDVLFGVDREHGVIARVDAQTGWRQSVGAIADPDLEGLAYDASGPWLFALSSSTGELFRMSADATGVGDAVSVGQITTLGSTWAELRSLAIAEDQLYTIDHQTGSLLRVDRDTAEAEVQATLPEHPGLQSLTYDPQRRLLLAYADVARQLIGLEIDTLGNKQVILEGTVPHIGSLAWIASLRRLVGTDVENGKLVTLQQLEAEPEPPGPRDLRALAVADLAPGVFGFDLASSTYVGVELGSNLVTDISVVEGLAIEAMATDPDTGITYAVDTNTASLYTIDAAGAFTRVGAEGALGSQSIRALAFHAAVAPGALYGVDGATQRLVLIDTALGTATPVGTDPLALPTLEAMTYDPVSEKLLAIDRESRAFVEVNHVTGEVDPIAALVLEAVHAMAALRDTGEVLVSDGNHDQIVVIDRYTGDVIGAFHELEQHRGAQDEEVATLLWPRKSARPGHVLSFALAVTEAFDESAHLVFRSGEKVLYRKAFEPTAFTTIAALPAEVRGALKPGVEVTWGVEFAGTKSAILTSFTLVEDTKADAELKALKAHPYLSKQAPAIREALAARKLLRRGFAGEALRRYVAVAASKRGGSMARRGIVGALRILFEQKNPTWQPDRMIDWLRAPEPAAIQARILVQEGTILPVPLLPPAQPK